MRVEKNSFRVISTTSGKLIVESPLRLDANGREPKDCLLLDGVDGSISVKDKASVYPSSSHGIQSTTQVVGVLGLVELSMSKWLVVATQRDLAATLQSHKIWRIRKGQFLPLGGALDLHALIDKGADAETLSKAAMDQELLDHLSRILNSGHLYFSTTYDLTHSLQHNSLKFSSNGPKKTLIDDRYFFNAHFAAPFLSDFGPWIIKTICGFAGSVDIEHNPNQVDLNTSPLNNDVEDTISLKKERQPTRLYTVTLISRENHRRIGTRYVRRGLDSQGNTANNVEMEQIVFHHDFVKNNHVSSFVQMRGSVPAIWGQDLDLSYKPKLLIADIKKSDVWSVIEKHYKDTASQYVSEDPSTPSGKIICVNLLDTAKFEGPLTQTYEQVVKTLQSDRVDYEEFPMHKYCKNMNYRNMDILLDRVRQRLLKAGMFNGRGLVPSLVPLENDFKSSNLQTGFARVSCLDSLDRTNLTCSWFAKYILPYQIQYVTPDFAATSILHSSVVPPIAVNDTAYTTRQAILKHMSRITNLWADSGDAISILYAGTGALKADVTRNGKRSVIQGPLNDGLNSITRYYLNNFADGTKQDGYDFWTGKVSSETLRKVASSQAIQVTQRLHHPILDPNHSLAAKLLPRRMIETFEPILQTASEYSQEKKALTNVKCGVKLTDFDSEGRPLTMLGMMITAIRMCGPERIMSFFDLIVAMWVFFYVMVLVRLFGVDGSKVVNRPKFSQEYETIYMVTGYPKKPIEDKKLA